MAGVITLDASALIALYESSDLHHEWARKMLTQTLDFDLGMSALTWAEVMVRPARSGLLVEFITNTLGLSIEINPLTDLDAEPIAQIRAATKLTMPDSVVLHTAQVTGGAIATTDAKLAKVSADLGLKVFSPQFRN